MKDFKQLIAGIIIATAFAAAGVASASTITLMLGTDTLTPADGVPSDWRYYCAGTKPARVLDAEDIIFYRPVASEREWSDSPQGWRAARAWVERWHADPANVERTAPVGKVLSRIVLTRVMLTAAEYVDDPQAPYGSPRIKRFADVPVTRFVVAAVLWSAIIPAVESAA